MSQSFSWEAFNRVPVVGILRNMPKARIENIIRSYIEAGLTTLEITMNSPDAAATIAAQVRAFGHQLNIGAGTVCTPEDLETALNVGARFIVTPILSKEVVAQCVSSKVPVFAGAYTPTEIYTAWAAGASMVKVFPAGRLGPEYIKEVLAPLNQLKLMPTGGVSADNMTAYLRAGAAGLGMGSSLFPRQLIENEQWDKLTDHLSALVKQYHHFKKDR